MEQDKTNPTNRPKRRETWGRKANPLSLAPTKRSGGENRESLQNRVTAAAAGLHEVLTLFELALLAGIERLHRTMVAHHTGIDGALGALALMLGQDLLVGFHDGFDFFFCHGLLMIMG